MRSQTRAQLDAALEEYRSLTGRIRHMRDDLSSLTATARSADGCARVTVNAWGELIRLTFDPSTARRVDPTVLAARAVEAAGSAAADVRRRKQAVMSELLPPGLRQLVDHDGAALRGLVAEQGMPVRDLSTAPGERA